MTLTEFYQELYLEAIENGEWKSFLTGIPLPIQPVMANMMHVLAKGKSKYPNFKYYKKNLAFGTCEEHHLFDNGSDEQRQRYSEEVKQSGGFCDWQKLYDLRDELKQEYKEKYG